MCIFILGVLPSECDIETIESVCISHGLHFDVIKNKHLTAQFNQKLFGRLTRDQCDCDTPLGKNVEYDNPQKDPIQVKIDRYRRKGWSESKINRAIESAKRNADLYAEALKPFRNLLNELLSSNKLNSFGFLLHFYNGAMEEKFVVEFQQVSLKNCSDELLFNLRQDILYEFSKESFKHF